MFSLLIFKHDILQPPCLLIYVFYILAPSEKRYKCPECGKLLKSKLKRHLMEVHNSSENRAKSAVLQHKYGKDEKLDSGRITKGGKKDYHVIKQCPYDSCNVVRLRLSPHLVKKHKLVVGSEAYKIQLKQAIPWKGYSDKESRDKNWDIVRRNSIREAI